MGTEPSAIAPLTAAQVASAELRLAIDDQLIVQPVGHDRQHFDQAVLPRVAGAAPIGASAPATSVD
jgi:hypothetical protein